MTSDKYQKKVPAQPQSPAISPEQKFLEDYQRLCQEQGFEIVASPQWIKRDDNSYSMVIKMTLSKIYP